MITPFPRLARWRLLVMFATFAGLAFAQGSAAEIRQFTTKSFAEIKRAHAGRAFLLAFWSVTCEPCKEELAVITELHRKFPQVPVILVAADLPKMASAVTRFLASEELGRIETWQFADDFTEKVRFTVDRTWRGELPRTYFFDAQHEMTSHTGVLERRELEAWLQRAVSARESKRIDDRRR